MLGKALALASDGFKNRKDKGGEPYMLHCIRVMNNLHTKDHELMSIAILHDVVEDGVTSLEGLTFMGFSSRVVRAVALLTHEKNVPYMDYIKALAHNEDAVAVKIADLRDNSDITRLKGLTKADHDRMEKYNIAYTYLSKLK